MNMENCFWFKGVADPVGRGHAAGKVCPVHLPFGQIKGNVCHDNRRFGIYLDFQRPRMLPRDENGFVADIENPTSNCFNEVDADGKDTGLVPANVVEDELDWHNEFVGQYTLTDRCSLLAICRHQQSTLHVLEIFEEFCGWKFVSHHRFDLHQCPHSG